MKKQFVLILTFALFILKITFSLPDNFHSDFDADGKVITDLGANDYGSLLIIQPDRKTVVGGASDSEFSVVMNKD